MDLSPSIRKKTWENAPCNFEHSWHVQRDLTKIPACLGLFDLASRWGYRSAINAADKIPSIRAIRAANSRRDAGCHPWCVLTEDYRWNWRENRYAMLRYRFSDRRSALKTRNVQPNVFSSSAARFYLSRAFVSDIRCSWHLVFSHLQLAASASENISLGRRRVVVGLTAGFSTLHLNFKRAYS